MSYFFKRILERIFRFQARLVLRKYNPRIVAVTGSVGKTSAKDAIYSVLSRSVYVRASEKSFNNELGLPLTILGLPTGGNNPLRWLENILDGFLLLVVPVEYPEWLVLELGADRPGDIQSVARWLATDVVVITRLPDVPAHIEYFDSVEQVWEEKASLIDSLRVGGSVVIFNDDNSLPFLMPRIEKKGASYVTYGVSGDVMVRADDFSLVFSDGAERWPIGMSARITLDQKSAPLMLVGAVGPHMLLSVLAAAGVAHALGKDLIESLQALASYTPPPGRMHLLSGIKGSLIIDDTYNSSPAAAAAALNTLAFVCQERGPGLPGRTIAVMGDMLELGKHSVDAHRSIGAHVARTAELLLTVGFRARDIAEGALDVGFPESSVLQFEDARSAGLELQNLITEGDCILIKGSQGMRMERVVEEIMAEPERAHELLVRQDSGWKKIV